MSDGSDQVDAGMRAGFEPRGGDSVLTILRALAGSVPRISLDGYEGGDTSKQRYEVLGEIARGGMGVVMRGRDVDLGRDVAMKVIRPEFARSADIVRRFVEEAQINGQLQHPGIVPIYELGLHQGRQAYFTMKLVKGRTLSAILQERVAPDAERRRFVSIFEQVCQTVAYAHSRGVIHRDLKPSNVMVGAFGEVQVVDWGFAKVLAQAADAGEPVLPDKSVVRTVRTGSSGSESKAGSVMGTPAYMPPEQALGQTDQLDERADVFALGAILCEILTGKPPYVVESGDLLVQAARADLTSAHARLEQCGADRDLVDLACACLDANAEARPRNAGVVVAGVMSHLASADERARKAELDAAQQRVKALEERKRRRLTVGLAAAILLAVLVAGGTYGWFARERLRRTQRNTLAVRDAIAEATRRQAEAQGTGSLDKWGLALAAARGAKDLAGTVEVDRGTVTRAEEITVEVERQYRQAEVASARARKDAETMRTLDEVRVRRGDTKSLAAFRREFAQTFASYGIDLETLEPAEVVARIRASAIPDVLCQALDDMVYALRRSGEDGDANRLAEITNEADSDPWRRDLRGAGHDIETLRELAAQPGPRNPSSVVLLAHCLAAATSVDEALAYLRSVQVRYPGDFWINYWIGYWLATYAQPPRPREAIGYMRAALAARPSSARLQHDLGVALEKDGDPDAAIAAWREAERLEPDLHLHVHILETLAKKGELASELAKLEADAQANPESAEAQYKLGIALRISEKPAAALEALRRAVALAPDVAEVHMALGDTLWGLKRLDEARQSFQRVTELAPGNGSAWHRMGMMYGMQGRLRDAIRSYEEAIRADPELPRFRVQLAQARIRSGQLEEAMREYEEIRRRFPGENLDGLGFWLAQAMWKNGLDVEARALAQEMIAGLDAKLEENPEEVDALVGLAGLYGDCLWEFDRGIELLERAKSLEPDRWDCAWSLAVLHEKKGSRKEALKWYREAARLAPEQGGTQTNLANSLAEDGSIDDAIIANEAALKVRDDPIVRVRLGCCLVHQGRGQEALVNLDRYREMLDLPEGWKMSPERWKQDREMLLGLAARADAILAGEVAPGSARELLLFAWACYESWDTGRAVRLFRQAFAADPDLALEPAPYEGRWTWRAISAHAFVLAGLRLGATASALSDDECRALRADALSSLDSDLDDWERHLSSGKDHAAAEVVEALAPRHGWFGLTRYGDRFAGLPEQERAGWSAYWERLGRILRSARAAR